MKVGGAMKKDWSQKEENFWPMAAVGFVEVYGSDEEAECTSNV